MNKITPILFLILFLSKISNALVIPTQSSIVSIPSQGKITQRAGSYRFKDTRGRTIINSKYAGKTIPIRVFSKKLSLKYRKPIKFNKFGYPDFSKYSKRNVKTNKLTGNHQKDIKIVEKILKKRNPKWKKRPGYTWHHYQDGKTMQYVPTDLHSSIPHSGGASRLRDKN